MFIPAIRQDQNGTELFQCFLGAEVLADPKRVVADAFSSSNRHGYQREKAPTRMRAFASYLLSQDEYEDAGGMCANSLVLNSREKLPFSPIDDKGFGLVDIGDKKLYEVDGQHRIGGFQMALEEDPQRVSGFRFPCVIVNGLDRIHEAVVFYLINTKQQKVSTDLCQRLIAENLNTTRLGDALLAQGKDWMKEALKVVDAINDTHGQPWHRKIKLPGVGFESLGKTFVSQNGFLTSLRPILTAEPYRSMPTHDVITLLTRYWTAIRNVLPQCFVEGEQRNYVIQKSGGVLAMHSLFPAVVERARRRETRITQETLEELLGNVLEDGPDYWLSKNDQGAAAFGSSHKGVRILVSNLRSKLLDETPVILV